jgi:hypothetical protein
MTKPKRVEPALDLLRALFMSNDPGVHARYDQHLAGAALAIADCTRHALLAEAKKHSDPRVLEDCTTFAAHCHRAKEHVTVRVDLETRRMDALRKGEIFDATTTHHALAAKISGNLVVALDPEPLRVLGADAIVLPPAIIDPHAPPPAGRPAPSAPHLRIMDGGSRPHDAAPGWPSPDTGPEHPRRTELGS